MHFHGLDGMRALAALLVVCFHSAFWLGFIAPTSIAGLPAIVRSVFLCGWVGVDVFFVLSGFLIGRMLLLQLADGSVRFGAFYLRRTFRIFPAYYVVLTASALLFSRLESFRPLYGASSDVVLRRSWANYAYVGNYAYGVMVPNAMSWAWSLCIEEHFYLVLPALLVLLFRLVRGPGRFATLLALALAPVAARWLVFLRDPVRTLPVLAVYPQSHTHCDGLFAGVLVAYVYVHHREALSRLVARFATPCWVVALGCFGSILVWGGWLLPGFFRVVPQFLILAVGSGLLLLTALLSHGRLARFFAHPAWYPLARVSYGTYLVHLFAVFAMLRWWPRGPYGVAASVVSLLGFTAAVTLLSVVAAALLFLLLERPMLDWGATLARRHAPGAVADPAPIATDRPARIARQA